LNSTATGTNPILVGQANGQQVFSVDTTGTINATGVNASGAIKAASIQLASDAAAPFSSAPRMTWTTFLPGQLITAYAANSMFPDQAITVTRITMRTKTAAIGSCSPVSLIVSISNPTGSIVQNLAFSPGGGSLSFADSGAISVSFPAGQEIDLSVQTPFKTCNVIAADANVTVEYRMQ
jgi:hypothetical protein